MEEIAYCGFRCDRCPVYQAYASDDDAAKKDLARRYSTAERLLSPPDIHCTGCRAADHTLPVFCSGCFIRTCARQKNLPHCGACADYPCAYLEKHVPAESPSRRLLEQWRKKEGNGQLK
ncbi:MAG: DUF3795 domain-containing protein [Oscillospiraceae bacterium]|nr:DUF3795 domain-containing protein [Oscillospiraceae bacterium]